MPNKKAEKDAIDARSRFTGAGGVGRGERGG